MGIEKLLRHFLVFFLALLAVQFGVYAFAWLGDREKPFQASLETVAAVRSEPDSDSGQGKPSPVPLPEPKPVTEVNAAAATAVQVVNGQPITLFSKSADVALPVASLTKLMTALVVLERYDLGQPITISAEAMTVLGEQGNLAQGQIFYVKDLLYVMLIESSNRAAYALSEHLGVDPFIIAMNESAQALGLSNTHFVDSTGLSAGSYSSAADIAKLTQHLLEHYPLFGEIIGLGEYNLYLADDQLHHALVTTNQLLGQHGITGGKTGYTDAAKGCFMAVQKADIGYNINVVLGADDRFLEMSKLIEITP